MERLTMRTLLLVTDDPELGRMVAGVIPEGWRLHKASTAGQAMRFIESGPPDIICADLVLAGSDGLSFLGAVRDRLSPVPPAVLCMPAVHDGATRAKAAALKVEHTLKRPFDEEDVAGVFAELFDSQAPPPMRLLEYLGDGFSNTAVRQAHLAAADTQISFLFGGGHLWAIRHPHFTEHYQKALVEAGVDHATDAYEDSWIGLAELEERMRTSPDLTMIKRASVLSILASCPLHALFEARVGEVIIPEGLVPVDIPSLLVDLVGHVPSEVLDPLSDPALKVRRAEEVIPEDLAIGPQHGYILSQCSEARAPAELVQTGIMPENEVLAGVYLLLLLGLLVPLPPVEGPFRISALAEGLETANIRIRRQSEAIQSLVRSFQLPGQNPYDILGVEKDTSLNGALEAYEAMQNRLSGGKLHPEVHKKHHKDILFLKAKLSEAYLLIESAFIDSRKNKEEKDAAEAEGGDNGAAAALSKKVRKEEARMLYERALAFMEQDQAFEASQCLKVALFHDPECAPCHNLMARIHELNPSVKSKHLAEESYQKAHQLEPGEMDFILDLAEFYANHGLYARCRTYLDKAQAIELRNPRAIGLRKAIKGKG
jgi:CheY-like chemotaxis protein